MDTHSERHYSIGRHYREVVLPYQELRDQLLDALADHDLAFHPGGNLTLGGLFARLAATEQAYADSFRTFRARFEFDPPEAGATASVAALKALFASTDAAFQAALAGVSRADVADRPVDRGGGHKLSVFLHLDVYREALLLFCGKASVYLAMMGREPPGKWRSWIWL